LPSHSKTLSEFKNMSICGTCILILIVEMASKPFSDFYAGQRSFRLK